MIDAEANFAGRYMLTKQGAISKEVESDSPASDL
jgi:hypothetical protein